jgi:hypothetical protein
VGKTGNMVDAKTIEAIGFHDAMLDVSWMDCTKLTLTVSLGEDVFIIFLVVVL